LDRKGDVVPLVIADNGIALPVSGAVLGAESGLVETEFNSFGSGIIAPADNLTIAGGLNPRSYSEGVSAEKPLVTAYVHVIRVSGKLHSLSEKTGYKLWIAVYRSVAVITGVIKHSAGTLVVKLPVSDETWVLSIR
jgi:hypothetical protein